MIAVFLVAALTALGLRRMFSRRLPEAAPIRSERVAPNGSRREQPFGAQAGVPSPSATDHHHASAGQWTSSASEPVARPAAPASESIPDDGHTMWASPTSGQPFDLAFVPAGTQLIFTTRPSQFSGLADADPLQFTFGSWATDWQAWFKRIVPGGLIQIEQLTVSLFPDAESDVVHVAFVLRFAETAPLADAGVNRSRRFAVPAPPGWSNTTTDWFAGRPAEAGERLLVIASSQQLDELLASNGAPPPLRREMERLLAESDALRLINVLFTPNLLSGHRDTLLTGKATRLADPVIEFLGEGIQAVLVSLHENRDAFFVELRAACPAGRMPNQLARQLNGRLDQIAHLIRQRVAAADPHPYGRQIVTRFPRMLELLARYTRHGAQEGDALLRCYLPARAAHNVALAVRLLLDEPAQRTDRSTSRPTERTASLAERLRQRVSLSFRRDTLENALRALGDEIGVEIEIMGRDLQLAGITRNQSFGIDLKDRPAEEILQRIVELANPDLSADGLSDPRQTLVYVIRTQAPDHAKRRSEDDATSRRSIPDDRKGTDLGASSKKIYLTTRRQAQQRGDRLPAVFLSPESRPPGNIR
ncbi:MAG: hypothetical protein ACC645_24780 [Pirellulales bacterium]